MAETVDVTNLATGRFFVLDLCVKVKIFILDKDFVKNKYDIIILLNYVEAGYY